MTLRIHQSPLIPMPSGDPAGRQPAPASEQGTGFVMFPRHLIGRPGLKDADYPLLLLMGWTHYRDGSIAATNAELGAVLGKSPTSVGESLLRLERLGLIRRDMVSPTTRSGIRLCYDPFGRDDLLVAPPENPGGATERASRESGKRLPRIREAPPENPGGHPIKEFETNTTSSSEVQEADGRPSTVDIQAPPDAVATVEPVNADVGADEEAWGEFIDLEAEVKTPAQLVEWIRLWVAVDPQDNPRDAATVKAIRPWLAWLHTQGVPVNRAIPWIQAATLKAMDADDPKAYAFSIMENWIAKGGRPCDREAAAAAATAGAAAAAAEVRDAAVKEEVRERAALKAEADTREARWNRLSTLDRDRISSEVAEANPTIRKWPALLHPIELHAMDASHRKEKVTA